MPVDLFFSSFLFFICLAILWSSLIGQSSQSVTAGIEPVFWVRIFSSFVIKSTRTRQRELVQQDWKGKKGKRLSHLKPREKNMLYMSPTTRGQSGYFHVWGHYDPNYFNFLCCSYCKLQLWLYDWAYYQINAIVSTLVTNENWGCEDSSKYRSLNMVCEVADKLRSTKDLFCESAINHYHSCDFTILTPPATVTCPTVSHSRIVGHVPGMSKQLFSCTTQAGWDDRMSEQDIFNLKNLEMDHALASTISCSGRGLVSHCVWIGRELVIWASIKGRLGN